MVHCAVVVISRIPYVYVGTCYLISRPLCLQLSVYLRLSLLGLTIALQVVSNSASANSIILGTYVPHQQGNQLRVQFQQGNHLKISQYTVPKSCPDDVHVQLHSLVGWLGHFGL